MDTDEHAGRELLVEPSSFDWWFVLVLLLAVVIVENASVVVFVDLHETSVTLR